MNIRSAAILVFGLLSFTLLGSADAGGQHVSLSQAEADADLAKFDRDNPGCELWTNWQRMCSRLGGETHCIKDAAHIVRPSKAFCVGHWDGLDRQSIASQFRFCRKRGEIYYSAKRLPVCEEYVAERPFDGRRLATRVSPGCAEWRQEITGQRARSYSESGYYCAKFTLNPCTDYSAHHRNFEQNMPDEAGIVAGSSAAGLDGQAVYGLSCGGGK